MQSELDSALRIFFKKTSYSPPPVARSGSTNNDSEIFLARSPFLVSSMDHECYPFKTRALMDRDVEGPCRTPEFPHYMGCVVSTVKFV